MKDEYWVVNYHIKWGNRTHTEASHSVVYIYGTLLPNQVQRKENVLFTGHTHNTTLELSQSLTQRPETTTSVAVLPCHALPNRFYQDSKEEADSSSSFAIFSPISAVPGRQGTWLHHERDRQQSHWYHMAHLFVWETERPALLAGRNVLTTLFNAFFSTLYVIGWIPRFI